MSNSDDDQKDVAYPQALNDLGMLNPSRSDPAEGHVVDHGFMLWKVRRALVDATAPRDVVALTKQLRELRGY